MSCCGGLPRRATAAAVRVGGPIWVAVAIAHAFGAGSLTWIDVLLLLGPLVVVPIGLDLIDLPLVPATAALSAVALVPAFLAERGLAAATLTLLWLAAATLLASIAVGEWISGRRDIVSTARAMAAGWLLVGAVPLFVTRMGWTAFGLHEPIIELTAVHYTFAGFGASVLAACAARVSAGRHPRTSTAYVVLVGGSPPVIATGFVFDSAVLQVGGAVLLTAGIWLLAAVTLLHVRRVRSGVARALLTVSALSPFVPMVLAVAWALAEHADTPALSTPDMARVHGTINAFGFTLAGLLGWWLVSDARAHAASSRKRARNRRKRSVDNRRTVVS